jgi:hypothetical protein
MQDEGWWFLLQCIAVSNNHHRFLFPLLQTLLKEVQSFIFVCLRSEAEAAATSLPVVNQDTALNFRWIDTRTPASQAIFRIQSG